MWRRRLLQIGFVLGALALPGAAAWAQPRGCVDTTRMRETRAVDDSTIVVIMTGRDYRKIALMGRCPGLKIQGGFSYETSITQLCAGDIITVLGGGGFRCGIDAITPLSATEAKELLSRPKR